MISYRYSAPVLARENCPDAHSIMDQLAEHVLAQNSIDQAMMKLHRQGVKERHGDSLD